METLIIHAESEKIKALMKILKAFNITFERKKEGDFKYDKEFVKKMDKSIQQASEGKTTKIKVEDLWK